MANEVLQLEARMKNFISGEIGNINKSLGEFKNTSTESMAKASSGTKQFLTTMGGFATAQVALGALRGAWQAMSGTISESIAAYDKQITAQELLRNALGFTSQALLDQASAIQTKTRYGDEEIIQAQARLAQFVKEEDQIRKLTPLIVDFAAAKQMNLAAAADLVGKSIGSSTNALTRYGIEITGAVGSTERTETAMRNMAKQVDGAAQSIGAVGSGPAIQLEMALGDITEGLGKSITEGINPFINIIVKDLLPVLKLWVDGIGTIIHLWSTGMQQILGVTRSNNASIVDNFETTVDSTTEIIKEEAITWETINKERAAFSINMQKQLLFEEMKRRKASVGEEEDATTKQLAIWDLYQQKLKVINNKAAEDAKNNQKKSIDDVNSLLDSIGKDIGNDQGDALSMFLGDVSEIDAVNAAIKTAQESLEDTTLSIMESGVEKELALNQLKLDRELEQYKTNKEAKALINDKYKIIGDKIESDGKKEQKKQDDDNTRARIQNWDRGTSVVLGSFSQIAKASKAGAGVQKGIDIAQATANTALAVTKSLATPWMIPFIIASGMAQVAIIGQQKYAGGGVVGGTPSAGDSVSAMLTPGEMILNKEQQTKMWNLLTTNNDNRSRSSNDAVNLHINVGAGGNYDQSAAQYTVDSLVPIIGKAMLQAKNEGRLTDYEYAR